MGFHKDSSEGGNNYVRHEIKTYQRKGDQVRSEYERLNPDGTVTKSVAYGDCREGLRYRTFQMGLDGAVREVAAEHFSPKFVTAAPQQQQPVPQQPVPQQPAPQQQPRKTLAFVVEPRQQDQSGTSTWRVRTYNIQQEKPAEPSPQKVTPWWYEPLKEAYTDTVKEEEKPPVEPEKKLSKSIFDWFDDDFFSMKPFKSSLFQKNSFDLLGDSFFDQPLLGLSRALLRDF